MNCCFLSVYGHVVFFIFDCSSPVAGVTGYIGGLINQAVGNVFSNNQPTGFTLNQNLGGNTGNFLRKR